jgi:putative heme iron utilization protein
VLVYYVWPESLSGKEVEQDNKIDARDLQRLCSLLREQRWAALATARDGQPFASWVSFVLERRPVSIVLHISSLAVHTRFLQLDPRCSLAISEPDQQQGDPQELARISFQCRATVVAESDEGYDGLKSHYLARFPQAERTFEFPDFMLVRLVPEFARYVPGFGRVHRLDPGMLHGICEGQAAGGVMS